MERCKVFFFNLTDLEQLFIRLRETVHITHLLLSGIYAQYVPWSLVSIAIFWWTYFSEDHPPLLRA